MKKMFCFVIISLITTISFAANSDVYIKGKVIEDLSDFPLVYATILLSSLPDTSFVSVTISDENGNFRFDNLNKSTYLLRISYIGFETKLITVQVKSEPVMIDDIRLVESNILDEIVVIPKVKPFRTGDNGGIVANVSTTLLSTVGTANDVLQRMPGIFLDNNKIAVFGKGSPVIYINNRLVRDEQELERLESMDISTIELITNPGSKYDAEGRAVLVIKTKTKINGFSAQISERIRKAYYLGNNENISISYTKDNLSLFASYNHQYTKNKADEFHHYILDYDSLWIHDIAMPNFVYTNRTHQTSVGFDYSLNEKHAIGGEYQYYVLKAKDSTQINSVTMLNNTLYDEIFSKSLSSQKPVRHLLNIFYKGDFTERFSIRLDFDYLKNHDFIEQFSEEFSNMESRSVNTISQTDYTLIAGKLTNSYRSSYGLVEFGGEYNDISGDGFLLNPEGYIDNNIFTNFEKKAAGFINYSHSLYGIKISAGLRFEYTSIQFTEDSVKNIIVDKKYNDIYPNLSFSKQINDVDLSLSFNKRTQRPTFRQLNGNTFYVNRFSYQRGNPYLLKSNINDINLQSVYKRFYLNIGYAYGKNPIILTFQKQGTNAFISSYSNNPEYQEINMTLNYNSKISFWQPNYTVGFRKQFFTAIYDGYEDVYNKSNYFFRVYNDFILPYSLVLSCNYLYFSDTYTSNVETKSYQQVNIGLRKSFFQNRLSMNLTVNDIFNQSKIKSNMQLHDFNWNVERNYETRYVQLTLSYQFNNYGKKYRGENAAKDDINRF